ncbi:sensor histidine kinase [Vagococcus sp. PNs007]|uniref:histidine kinase n=1 Tax=Vagococcus proximus TaxID=2991417 RepID=A0ABT5WZ14_9ENTE|nr:sensor histidine kinase [Vagococcus proximus]MDF0478994.1 sensor histidine kinase [Vagococcus proximus]
MKQFFKRHILFPEKFGFTPYFWLLFLIPTIFSLFPINTTYRYFLIILLLIFIKAYRDAYTITTLLPLNILTQLLIAIFFGITEQNGYLFIFTAWEIGSIPLAKTTFKHYLIGYYSACLVSFIGSTIPHPPYSFSEWSTLMIPLGFAVVSPLAARSMGDSYRRSAQLSRNNQRLEAIVKQNERDRIARDLHDTVGQTFSIITLKTELAQKLIQKDASLAEKELSEIAQLSRASLNSVRSIVNNLHEKNIAETMIEEENNLKLANISIQSINETLSNTWPPDVQHLFSSVITEAVTNMIRHSKAQVASFTFSESSTHYSLSIKDNGIGIQTIRSGAFGLTSMERRMTEVGGNLTITSTNGTILTFTLPKGEL